MKGILIKNAMPKLINAAAPICYFILQYHHLM
jgi:hypothetical protein